MRRPTGGGPRQRLAIRCIAAIAAAALALLLSARTFGFGHVSATLSVLSSILTVVAFIALIVPIFETISGPGEHAAKADRVVWLAKQLADEVRTQWIAERAARALNEPEPIAVDWNTTDRPVAGNLTAVLDGQVGGNPIRLRLHGNLPEGAEKYRLLPKGQLVVLGEPGAGKTVLVMLMALSMLADRQSQDPVPVILPLGSWNVARSDLPSWIHSRIVEEYPNLFSTKEARILLSELMSEGRILPILDGLDEMQQQLRGRAIRAINQQIDPGQRFILTCRSIEFEEAVVDGGLLTSAAVVELEKVSVREATRYLVAGDPRHATAWSDVGRDLLERPRSALAEALSTPLMVGLARIVFATASSDPRQLLDQATFASRQSVEEFLLASYVPVAYGVDPSVPDAVNEEAYPKRWRQYRRADRWLRFFAAFSSAGESPRDLAWWMLPASLGRRRAQLVFVAFVGGTGTLAALTIFGLLIRLRTYLPLGLAVGGACGVTAAVAASFGSVPGPPVRLRPRLGTGASRADVIRSAIIGGLAPAALLAAAVAASTARLLVGIVAGVLAFGFTGLIAAAVRWSTPTERAIAASPRSVLATDRTSTLSQGSIIAALAGIVFALIFGDRYHSWRAAWGGILGGAFLGFGAMLGTSWSWYQASKFWLWLHRRSPLRLIAFLESAHQKGILRQAGSVYQFRHGSLQDHLAAGGASRSDG